ncbi:hypothetical protein SLA2020_433350 [Shorea laevis]
MGFQLTAVEHVFKGQLKVPLLASFLHQNSETLVDHSDQSRNGSFTFTSGTSPPSTVRTHPPMSTSPHVTLGNLSLRDEEIIPSPGANSFIQEVAPALQEGGMCLENSGP